MTDKATWLAGLKVGDRAIVGDHFVGIGRLTPQQFVTERGTRYRRSDGCPVGNHYGAELKEPTPERVNAIRHVRLAATLRHRVAWGGLPLATLEAVNELVSKAGKAE